jgi:hypothetical protein
LEPGVTLSMDIRCAEGLACRGLEHTHRCWGSGPVGGLDADITIRYSPRPWYVSGLTRISHGAAELVIYGV